MSVANLEDAPHSTKPDAVSNVPVTPRGPAHWVALLSTLVLAITAGYVAVTTSRMLVALAYRTPIWDHWQELIPEKFLVHPFAQHNEHRIFVPRLFLAVDCWLFGGQGWSCVTANVLFLVGTAAMLAWAVGRTVPRLEVAVFALGVTFLLSAHTWENLLWPFQIALVVVVPAALVSFIALTKAGPMSGNIAVLAAAAASYSAANGVLVPVLLVPLAVFLGRPRRDVIVLAFVAAGLIATYFVGFESAEHPTPMSVVRAPGLFCRYVAMFLGAPLSWGFKDRTVASEIIGGAGLFLWLVISTMTLLKRRSQQPPDWVLHFSMLFALGTAAVTAIGRMNMFAGQALASRYGTISFFFWIALMAELMRKAPLRELRAAAIALASAIAVHVASHQEIIAENTENILSNIRPGETALAAGALDVEAINHITPSPYLVKDALPTLKRNHWSIFHERWVDWLGTKLLPHIGKSDPHACAGVIEGARAVPSFDGPAYRVVGWAYSRRDAKPAERIFLVDEKGIVLGFGRVGFPRPDVKIRRKRLRNARVGFVGHVGRLPRDTVVVRAVALVDGGTRICRLSKDVTLIRAEGEKLVQILR